MSSYSVAKILAIYYWKPHHVTSRWGSGVCIYTIHGKLAICITVLLSEIEAIFKLSICQDVALLLVVTRLAGKGTVFISSLKTKLCEEGRLVPLSDNEATGMAIGRLPVVLQAFYRGLLHN